jgi:hypothetical protein
MGERRAANRVLVGKPEGTRALRNTSGADGIIIDLQQVEWVDREWGNLTLRKGTGGGLL